MVPSKFIRVENFRDRVFHLHENKLVLCHHSHCVVLEHGLLLVFIYLFFLFIKFIKFFIKLFILISHFLIMLFHLIQIAMKFFRIHGLDLFEFEVSGL